MTVESHNILIGVIPLFLGLCIYVAFSRVQRYTSTVESQIGKSLEHPHMIFLTFNMISLRERNVFKSLISK